MQELKMIFNEHEYSISIGKATKESYNDYEQRIEKQLNNLLDLLSADEEEYCVKANENPELKYLTEDEKLEKINEICENASTAYKDIMLKSYADLRIEYEKECKSAWDDLCDCLDKAIDELELDRQLDHDIDEDQVYEDIDDEKDNTDR